MKINKSNIKAIRVKLGLTQQDMAKKLGMSKSAYCSKENNKRRFTIEEAYKISEIFGLPIEKIFFGDIVHELTHKEVG